MSNHMSPTIDLEAEVCFALQRVLAAAVYEAAEDLGQLVDDWQYMDTPMSATEFRDRRVAADAATVVAVATDALTELAYGRVSRGADFAALLSIAASRLSSLMVTLRHSKETLQEHAEAGAPDYPGHPGSGAQTLATNESNVEDNQTDVDAARLAVTALAALERGTSRERHGNTQRLHPVPVGTAA